MAETATDVRATAPGTAAAGRPGRTVLRWILLLAPLAVLAQRAWARHWMSDDGFIHLRVVQQLLAGNGPVFNAGQRVEASTSPLWVFLLSVVDLLTPIRLEWIAVGLGIALTLTGLALAIFAARRLIGERAGGELWIPAGAAVFAVIPPVWTFASSGLENGLVYAWLGACLWVLAAWAREPARVRAAAAVLLGLGVLIRPELALYTLCFVVVVIVVTRRTVPVSRQLAFLAWVAAVPLAYQVFRMGYYGVLLPNTALAKSAGRVRWDVGWDYLHQSVDPYWLWVPVVVLLAGAYLPFAHRAWVDRATPAGLVAGAFLVGAILDAVYVVRVGGDFMHARLLLFPVFAFCAPVAVVPWRRAYLGVLALAPWVVVCAVSLRTPRDVYGNFGQASGNPVTVADFGLAPGQPGRAWFTGDGVYFANRKLPVPPIHPKPYVASYGVGVTSYALGPDVDVVDLLGLADPFTAHLELPRRGYPGHERPLPQPWIAARLVRPGAKVAAADFPAPIFLIQPIDDPDGQSFAQRVAIARRVLRCRKVVDFERSFSAPLTAGRVLSNLTGSFGNTGFLIPPEPRDALARLCTPAERRSTR
jgi:arabinofuranosyltransferase